jgi:IstB-like ATP binding protein
MGRERSVASTSNRKGLVSSVTPSPGRRFGHIVPLAVFDEPLLGQSALDRFCHRAHQVVIEGESYRKRTAPGSDSSKTGQKTTT